MLSVKSSVRYLRSCTSDLLPQKMLVVTESSMFPVTVRSSFYKEIMCSPLHVTQGLSKNDFIFVEMVSFNKLKAINEHLFPQDPAALNRFVLLWNSPKYQHRQESFHKS